MNRYNRWIDGYMNGWNNHKNKWIDEYIKRWIGGSMEG